MVLVFIEAGVLSIPISAFDILTAVVIGAIRPSPFIDPPIS